MSFEKDLLALMPNLTAFAMSLCNDLDRAHDLAQDTFVKAWGHADSFTEGTCLRAWVFTILRNTHFSNLRRKKREVEMPDESDYENVRWTNPSQEQSLHVYDVCDALTKMPSEQRTALLNTRLAGMSYQEVAEIDNTAIGTVKSRVNRAVKKLREILGNDYDEYGPIVLDHEAERRRRENKQKARLRRSAEHKAKQEPVTHLPVRMYTKDEIDALNASLAEQPTIESVAPSVGIPPEAPQLTVQVPQAKVVPVRQQIVTASQPTVVRSRLFVPRTTTYAGSGVVIRSTVMTRI